MYTKPIKKTGTKEFWVGLEGSSQGHAISEIWLKNNQPILVITEDILDLNRIETEIKFFTSNKNNDKILVFPDWETLPFDHFSPHQDIISERLLTLYRLPALQNTILLISLNTLMQRLLPRDYLETNSLVLQTKDHLSIEQFCIRLESYGYRRVSQVAEHGEFAVRGALFDIFPMGSNDPYRIELFDEEVETIRTFDPENQIATQKIQKIEILPGKEYPLTKDAISHFRQKWREHFVGDPTNSSVYQSISASEAPPGIEYYLSLFYPKLDTLFDYLSEKYLIINLCDIEITVTKMWQNIKMRHDQLSHDKDKPILNPKEIFLSTDELYANMNKFQQVHVIKPTQAQEFVAKAKNNVVIFKSEKIANISINYKEENPFSKLQKFIATTSARILFCAESPGRQESLLELLKKITLEVKTHANLANFLEVQDQYGLTIAPLEHGIYLEKKPGLPIAIISEPDLLGTQIIQPKRHKLSKQNPEALIRNLTELTLGAPVVHLDHGIGRYVGLQRIKVGDQETEFLTIAYKNSTKLYVPITALDLINRYTGGDAEHAPWHELGSKQWEKTKNETLKKIRDVAAELLNIYAERALNKGYIFKKPDADYEKFCAGFPFELTEDQKKAINETIEDMTSVQPMDRLICGDVGFGKTEVAMRAAFVAAHNAKQVAILSPTTLLTEQHYRNFLDRFATWPFKIEMLSRFRSQKQQQEILKNLANGKIDIIIGTHKLLQPDVIFKNLGLLIIDEEHRFGVKQKERIKKLKPQIDILALTATPIPRTLNMALSGIRNFSIIATPPVGRLAIKTFVQERNNYLIREAIVREIMRGGQIYFLHNDIATIEKTAEELSKMVPEARIAIAHAKMHERELEKVMSDFYHRRFNLLVTTTIIESGLDIPTANTIIINRADRFGLAQLHQLRGRVGRSHHQAYAYLLTPHKKSMTQDAVKRLNALASLEDLGVGFMLATQDLEIRGAGELLGEEQSGQIEAVGFDLYMEYLGKAVAVLKKGEKFELDEIMSSEAVEIDLKIPALIPEKYIDDINLRLTLYKRIANAKSNQELEDLEAEMINRFGLLEKETVNLFAETKIKLAAEKLKIKKIQASTKNGMIEFKAQPNIDAKKVIYLLQKEPQKYKLKGPNRLEFFLQCSTAEELIAFIQKLITQLEK